MQRDIYIIITQLSYIISILIKYGIQPRYFELIYNAKVHTKIYTTDDRSINRRALK